MKISSATAITTGVCMVEIVAVKFTIAIKQQKALLLFTLILTTVRHIGEAAHGEPNNSTTSPCLGR